jgi:glycosyltransferase involved in cell wall biosynthesis
VEEGTLQQQKNINPAILFEPDGYRMDGQRLMGRQAAGNGFLRAVVKAAGGQPVVGYTPRKASAEAFARTVQEIDPAAKAQWLSPARPDLLAQLGHLYLPGPGLGELARQRLRAGPAAWSLTGITHTTASHAAMDAIVDLLAAPVMPWDALICTSNAVLGTVKTVLQAQAEFLRWRFGKEAKFTLPQLPVIPLGVHCEDFAFTPQDRKEAREALGIAEDEVVALFVGRLSFHAKAHPHAMYLGLQAAAKRTGKKLVLVQCGWFANEAIERAFKEGAAATCPDVRCLYTDGRDAAQRARSWACADLFISLSDNIQETFGLTPIEAMAAGLPVVVTDWDGYKDTVRDGVDGFRIPTWAPPAEPTAWGGLAWRYEAGLIDYDQYCGYSAAGISVDLQVFTERMAQLCADGTLRRRLGEAGKARAAAAFAWPVVLERYRALWAELARAREAAKPRLAFGRAWAGRLEPAQAFAGYATHSLGPQTHARLVPGASDPAAYEAQLRSGLFGYLAGSLPAPAAVGAAWPALAQGCPANALVGALGKDLASVLHALAGLAKMGLVRLSERP